MGCMAEQTQVKRRRGSWRRVPGQRLLGGVAAGVSTGTGVDVTVVRTVFVLLALAGGFGIACYAVAWLLVPATGEDANIGSKALTDRNGMTLAAGLASLLIAVFVLLSLVGAGWIGSLAWSFVISASAIVLIARNAPGDEQLTLRRLADPLIGFTGDTRRSRVALRAVIAGVLLIAGVTTLLVGHTNTALLRPLAGVILVIAAMVVVLGPWWLRAGRDLVDERQARARAEERADMASRVHDSVLQTLALIQRRASDPQQVIQIARAQERELRSWLFDGQAPGSMAADLTFGAGVRLIQTDVEAQHGVSVEVITVGDCALDENLEAMLAAAREATVNAAKWSGAPVVSLYAEVEPNLVSLFVRDRGRGFDSSTVPADRRGLSEFDPYPDGALRRHQQCPQCSQGGNRGGAVDASDRRDRHVATGVSSATVNRPRVFIVDDHGLFRAGVRSELGTRIDVIGEADEVEPAIAGIAASEPDVVLLDVHMPGGGGQAVVTALRATHPQVRFLALSASDAPEDVIAVIRAGARGYVTKTISGAELVDAVYRVAAGEAVFSPRLAGFVLDAFAALPAADQEPPSFDPELDQLTPREREVLRLIARGFTYKEIARELFISAKTVESHVSSVLRKLQLSTRHQLTRWATERRLS